MGIDIIMLQETGNPSNSSWSIGHYFVFSSAAKKAKSHFIGDVMIIVHKRFINRVCDIWRISNRIITLYIKKCSSILYTLKITSAYAPTAAYDNDILDQFWGQLSTHLERS